VAGLAKLIQSKAKNCLQQILVLVLVLLPSLSTTQEPLHYPIETRFGVLNAGSVHRCNRQRDVCVDDATLELDGEIIREDLHRRHPHPVIQKFEWGERDVLLFEIWSGGASCCRSYQFLILDENGVSHFDDFGEHGFGAKEFEVNEDQISFRLERDYPPNIDHWLIIFDGTTVETNVIYEDGTGLEIAGNGADVIRWLGSNPQNLWHNGAERNRFRKIMDEGALDCLRTSTINAVAFSLSNGFLVSDGFWPRQGGSRHGYIAIEVETGRPFAALMWGDDIHYFGSNSEDFPTALKNWIEQNAEDRHARGREIFGDRLSEIESDYAEFCS